VSEPLSNGRGRPSTYRETHAEALAEHIAQGGTLSAFAQAIGAGRRTISRWLSTRPDFAAAMTKPQDPPPMVVRPSRPAAFSLAVWGAPQPRPDDTVPRYVKQTLDWVDDMLDARAA
jgi:hypothetical protein